MVTAAGGTGIAMRIDHTVEDQVAELFERVRRECGRLDVLALVMTGQAASWKSFLDEEPASGRLFVEGWIWPRPDYAVLDAAFEQAKQTFLALQILNHFLTIY